MSPITCVDRELDCWVAEHLEGWRDIKKMPWGDYAGKQIDMEDDYKVIPYYSSDDFQAYTVLQRAAVRFKAVEVTFGPHSCDCVIGNMSSSLGSFARSVCNTLRMAVEGKKDRTLEE